MAGKEKSKLRQMIEEYGIKDLNDVHEFVKMLTAETIQAALDAELDSELGYSKYDYKNKQTDNSRNGYSKKTVQSSAGEMDVKIPRDRQGEFEPQLVKKHHRCVYPDCKGACAAVIVIFCGATRPAPAIFKYIL